MSPCLSPGAAPDLPARCVNVIEQYLSTSERGQGKGALIERPYARRDQRMRGLELDSLIVTERLPSNEDGPVTDLRRCATR
jgi:hypothetical protein